MVEYPTDIITGRLRTCFQNKEIANELLPHLINIFGDIKKWDDTIK